MDALESDRDSSDPLSDGFDRLSDSERDEVYAQIDRVVRVAEPDPGQFAYRPKHRGLVLPLVVNAIAVALIVAAALVLTDVFATTPEATIVAASGAMTAEATLLDQFRREAAVRLDEQEREIGRIRAELSAVADSQSDLDAEGRAEAERRTRALESALASAVAAEAALRSQVASTADDADRAELATRLAALRDQAVGAQGEFDRLRTEREREARLAEQLSVLYRTAGDALTDGRTGDARAALEAVESLIASPLSVSLSLADRRGGVDALLIATLGDYAAVLEQRPAGPVDTASASADDPAREAEIAELRVEFETMQSELVASRQEVERLGGDLAAARAALGEANAALAGRATTAATQTAELTRLRNRVAALEADLSATRATAATQQQEISRLGRDLAAAERTIAARDASLRAATDAAAATARERARRAELLVPVRRAVDGSVAEVARDREALFASLQLKVRVLEALRQDAVLARFPGIDRDLETYLDALSEEQRTLGRSEALADLDRLLSDVRAGRTPDHALAARYRIDAAIALQSVLDSLDPLLR